MGSIEKVRIASLLLDEENPRLSKAASDSSWTQRAILEHFAADLKVQGLAADISARGMNPSKRPIIMTIDGSNRYITLEGNRRLAALKLLTNPSLAGSPSSIRRFHGLAGSAKELPSHVECVVVDARKQADHWIRIEHGLGKNGTSTLEWGPSEKSRYQQRLDGGGRYAKSTSLVDTLLEMGAIDSAAAREIPITTLDRLLSDPEVRSSLILDFEDLDLNKKNVEAVAAIVADLASGRVRVDDVRTKAQRSSYIAKVLENPSRTPSANLKAKSKTVVRTQPPHHKRKHLIPGDFRPKIAQKRLAELYDELRHLSVDRYPNAVGVLLRSFVEIAVWDFYERRAWTHTGSLAAGVRKTAKVLATEKAITHGVESVVVRAADDDDSFLSVKSLHQFVHGPYDLPIPIQLNRIWTGLQPFLEALIKADK